MADGVINVKGFEIGRGKPIICVPVMAPDREGIIKQISKYVQNGIGMIEWRVDAFSGAEDISAIEDILEDVKELLKDTVFVYTYRSKGQGGLGEATADVVRDIHIAGAKSQVVDFVDLEYFATDKPEKEIKELQNMGVYVITSHHDFDETPDKGIIHMLLEKMNESESDIVKLALMPQNIYDVFSLLIQTAYFHEKHPDKPVITMSMGQLGTISRVAGEYYGSCVTFGAGEELSAPGQLPYDKLSEVLEILDNSLK